MAKKIAIAVLATAGILAALLFHYSGGIDAGARAQFLRFVPSDATSVIFVDCENLRTSPLLKKLFDWAPHPTEESDYAQFVRETGFDYERDLQKLFIASANNESGSRKLVLAEGKFNRAKIQAYLGRSGKAAQQGSLQAYILPANGSEKSFSVALLGEQRIALTNSPDLFQAMAEAAKDPGHADWQTRFDRLAGSPVFAVIRQDHALSTTVNSAAPAGLRSPQLAALLNQLQWISIAGKPAGELLRIVADGETASDAVSLQLREFLQGIQVLGQNGLNDPELRRNMDSDERVAYLELLKSADIQRLDRGETKSVRVVLNITPRLLDMVASYKSSSVPDDNSAPPENAGKNSQSARPGTIRKK